MLNEALIPYLNTHSFQINENHSLIDNDGIIKLSFVDSVSVSTKKHRYYGTIFESDNLKTISFLNMIDIPLRVKKWNIEYLHISLISLLFLLFIPKDLKGGIFKMKKGLRRILIIIGSLLFALFTLKLDLAILLVSILLFVDIKLDSMKNLEG
jgi:hypothetical protein